jgi:hypothetical protein
MEKIKKFSTIIGIFTLVLMFSGCGEKYVGEKIMEKAIESQTGGKVNVDVDKDEMTIKSNDGEINLSSGANATLHKDFPKDVYIAPDAKIILSMANGQNKSFSVAYVTSGSLDGTYAKYKSELGSNGWVLENNLEILSADSKTAVFEKGTTRLSVIIGKSQESEYKGKTYVQVIGTEDVANN